MGIWFRNEKFDWKKLLAVLLSLFGVLIISQNSGDDSSNSSGSSNQHQEHSDTKSGFEVNTFVMVLLASAITYAIYEIAYKKYATKERDVSVAFSLYIIGWIGVASFLSGLVIMPINHFLGWETFTLPDRSVLGLLLVNAFCGLLYNLCLFFALTVLDSPLSINMAILFTIPGSQFVDYIFHSIHLSLIILVGTAFVILGFVVLQWRTISLENAKDVVAKSAYSGDYSPLADDCPPTPTTPTDEDMMKVFSSV
eukprot:TRINITY_DN1192_c0_g1_i1.p1 TRINITY_DN1192_c0_g1~~TRINITY_DN1192_c0_g1_i1.p1  ORF type:complete len:253 (+),score=45.50 TRINITY_DN1192_c0_g1_i1:242-1000(+)